MKTSHIYKKTTLTLVVPLPNQHPPTPLLFWVCFLSILQPNPILHIYKPLSSHPHFPLIMSKLKELPKDKHKYSFFHLLDMVESKSYNNPRLCFFLFFLWSRCFNLFYICTRNESDSYQNMFNFWVRSFEMLVLFRCHIFKMSKLFLYFSFL